MMALRFVLPLKLDIDLNSRGESMRAQFVKQRKIALQREAVAHAFLSHSLRSNLAKLREANPSGMWTVTLRRVAPLPLDDDNLAGRLKAVRDQVAKELGINDRDRAHLLFVPEQRSCPKREPHTVEVVIQRRLDWLYQETNRVAQDFQEALKAHHAAPAVDP